MTICTIRARLQQRAMANINDFKVPASTPASTGLPILETSQHSYENNNSVSVSQPPTQSSLDNTVLFSPRPPPLEHSNSHRHTENNLNIEGRSGQFVFQSEPLFWWLKQIMRNKFLLRRSLQTTHTRTTQATDPNPAAGPYEASWGR